MTLLPRGSCGRSSLWPICVVSLLVAASLQASADFDRYSEKPHFVTGETFALGVEWEGHGYPTVTFLPRGFLLYLEKNPDESIPTTSISGHDYYRAVTQDGVEVFVFHKNVSEQPFRSSFPRHKIIFNTDYMICRELGCNPDEEYEGLSIDPGNAFDYEAIEGHAGVVRVNGGRSGEITGYMRLDSIENLASRGIVTRADRDHPNYWITKDAIPALDTDCGETPEPGRILPNAEQGITDEMIRAAAPFMKAFDIGAAIELGGNPALRVDKERGGNGERMEYRLYHVSDLRNRRDPYDLAAEILHRCGDSPAVSGRIVSVVLKRIDSEDEFPLDGSRTPDDLVKYVRRPYLYSVNSASQYFQLLDGLAEIFHDRSLAGFFLAEFNRSCPFKHRRSGRCTQHSYDASD